MEPPHTYTHTVEFRCQRGGQACERINCRRGLVRQIRGDSVENLLDRSLTGDLVTVLVGVGGWGLLVERERYKRAEG